MCAPELQYHIIFWEIRSNTR